MILLHYVYVQSKTHVDTEKYIFSLSIVDDTVKQFSIKSDDCIADCIL